MLLKEIKWEKESNKYLVDMYSKSRGFVNITSAGNKNGITIPTRKVSKKDYRYNYINHKELYNDNRKISMNTFIDEDSFSEKNLNDVVAISIKTKLPSYHSMFDNKKFASVYEKEMLFALEEQSLTKLTPSYVIISDAIYFVYTLKDNVHLGHCEGSKKNKTIKFIKHIQNNLCSELNRKFPDKFEPVPLTASLNIPNSPFAIFKRKHDKNTKKTYSEVTLRGITELIVPEDGHAWDSLESLADVVGMPRYNSYRRNFKKAIKHHIKNREFYGVQGMLKRRMQLIKDVMYARRTNNDPRIKDRLEFQSFLNKNTFLYFNFAFELEKNYKKAVEMTKEMRLYVCPYLTDETIKRVYQNCSLKSELLTSGHGYKYTDEKLFEELYITKEEAANIYGYTTADKKEYDKMYSQKRRESIRDAKEKNNDARWQKMKDFRDKIITLRKEGFSYRKIAEVLKTTASNIAYHFKNHKTYMDNGLKSYCPI